ncbi:hypothetical protein [Gemmatimonas groenlandica]|uniref:Uncharacterized protein n=1 Tax=Gemmatimonas groenlandica TaxID=2732249 RepID=A0A6M4ISC0_9BACT|nr:hypothetical protein [Gemmatimonas groenlandica]QJR37643.1 hypothetical protein HKW67_20020 [Gemmatimonas groenlandica]
MHTMIIVSLLLNVVVLAPVCGGLLTKAPWARQSYGEATDARGILLAVYLAIGIVSALLLFRPDPPMVAALLVVQVVYKLCTPFTIGRLIHPVVLSNLAIVVVHAATLVSIWPVLRA